MFSSLHHISLPISLLSCTVRYFLSLMMPWIAKAGDSDKFFTVVLGLTQNNSKVKVKVQLVKKINVHVEV